ncbi:MAG TPA: nucleotide disphospho-sugar-binding domain-containing protein, partial [Herpetosiphonaceae bacterium]
AAVVHHGGAGTTGAGLRAGCPTLICPFFGDQSFWGRQVARLGVGVPPIPQRRLTVDRLTAALQRLTGTPAFRAQALALGRNLQAEDGVGRAVAWITQQVGAPSG